MTLAWWIWFVWFVVAFGVLEAIAFLDRKPNTTLSAHIWRYRRNALFRGLAGGIVMWLFLHLIWPWDQPHFWDDLIAIVSGTLIALTTKYRKRDGA